MQRTNDTQIYYAVLRGKSNRQLFEEEIQKMKILDAVVRVKEKMDLRILAYCVLDHAIHLLVRADKTVLEDFLKQTEESYEQDCAQEAFLRIDCLSDRKTFPQVNSSVREQGILYGAKEPVRSFGKSEWKEIKDPEAALRCMLNLHLMPVRRGIVRRPADYWWCSYPDYTGRQWMPIASPSEMLSKFSDHPREAVRLFQKRHQKALKHPEKGNLLQS